MLDEYNITITNNLECIDAVINEEHCPSKILKNKDVFYTFSIQFKLIFLIKMETEWSAWSVGKCTFSNNQHNLLQTRQCLGNSYCNCEGSDSEQHECVRVYFSNFSFQTTYM